MTHGHGHTGLERSKILSFSFVSSSTRSRDRSTWSARVNFLAVQVAILTGHCPLTCRYFEPCLQMGRSRVRLFPETGTAFALPTLAWLGWQQSRLLLGDFKRPSLIIRCAINRLTFVLHRTSMTCTKQIFSNRREINYWFMSQRAYVEIWSTQEVWRARKRRKSCSSRGQLY